MSYTPNDTIFVQIASYRDPELQHTLQDLFKKAKRPENIFVGLGHDYDMKEGSDKHLFQIPFSHQKQIRIDEIDYRTSTGPNPSKRRAQDLWKGERWMIQIDSHMRFCEGWDEIFVNDLKKIGNEGEGVIFTNVPSSYDEKTGVARFDGNAYAIGLFFKNPEFRIFCSPHQINKTRPAAAYIGCFFGGDASLIQSIKINPGMNHHDEMVNSLRYFTSGAKIYNYEKHVVAHLWTNHNSNSLAGRTNAYKSDLISDKMCLHIFGIKKTNDPKVFARIKGYELGDKRTLRDFERHSGIDFRSVKMRERSKQAEFEEWQEVGNICSVKKIFKSL